MSQKTLLPPEGPAGPGSEAPQESSLLLSDVHDACDARSDSPAPEEEVLDGAPPSPSGGRSSSSTQGGASSHGALISTQPQRLPPPTASVEPGNGNGDGDAGQSQNGRRVGLSNGARPEPRRHPSSTVSHKVQRKLQSSLSVHSDSSRRSKASSGSSHKPGSSPEERCASLILACLSCRGSELLLALLESCPSCLGGACAGCSLPDTPPEDLRCPAHCPAHCHPDLCEPCCLHAECLDFCLECAELCHNS